MRIDDWHLILPWACVARCVGQVLPGEGHQLYWITVLPEGVCVLSWCKGVPGSWESVGCCSRTGSLLQSLDVPVTTVWGNLRAVQLTDFECSLLLLDRCQGLKGFGSHVFEQWDFPFRSVGTVSLCSWYYFDYSQGIANRFYGRSIFYKENRASK